MKTQNGITLMSLVIYITAMIIVIAIMTLVVNSFYKNTQAVSVSTEDLIEFNNFNTYFLKEIKAKDNKVDSIKDNYILFSSGNSFSLSNDKIYYNNIEVCKNVAEITFKLGQDGDEQDNNIINVNISFNNFNKAMNYKVEEIY